MTLKHDVRAVARQFQICGEFLGAAPYGTGHIIDTSFQVHRENHNLDRCRTQFKLVESIEQQEEEMSRLVETI